MKLTTSRKTTRQKELVFYDKVKEVRKDNKQLVVNHQNILRYEIKLKSDIVNVMGDKYLISLYEPDKYAKLVTAWYDTYNQVPKLTKLPFYRCGFDFKKRFYKLVSEKSYSQFRRYRSIT